MGAWGDDEDDDDALPPRTETKVNAAGFKTVVEWSLNTAGQKVKKTTEVFVKTVETREAKCVAGRVARLKANKFGQAKGSQDDSNVTIVAHNEERVTMEVAESEDARAEPDSERRQLAAPARRAHAPAPRRSRSRSRSRSAAGQ